VPAEDPGPRPTLWHNRDFLAFWTGETLSLYGAQVTALALPLTVVLVFDAGPEQLGLVRFAQFVPYLLFGLLFGVWIDRVRRRPVMLGANVARMLLVGSVPALSALDLLNLPLLLATTFGIGVAGVLFDLSWMSYIPVLVRDRSYLVEANSKLGVTSSSADAAGPGLAGVLVGALTAPVAMIVDAVSFAVSLVSLLLIKVREPRPAVPATRRRLAPELAEGLRFVFGDRNLRALALVGCLCNFFVISTSTMFILYAVRDRGLSPALLGFVLSMGAVGGVIGALAAGRLLKRLPLGRVYAASVGTTFLGPAVIAAADGPRPVLLVLFVAAFVMVYVGVSVSNVVIVSLRQTITPNSLLARMNAAFRTLMYGGGSLGGPAGGLLAGVLGMRPALVVLAAGSAAMLAPVILSPVSRLPAMPAPATDPVPAPVETSTPG
jgi:MFS family permease